MDEFFYWLGVIYSGIFLLVGLCIFCGFIADYCWAKMQKAYGFMEIMAAYKKYNKEKSK